MYFDREARTRDIWNLESVFDLDWEAWTHSKWRIESIPLIFNWVFPWRFTGQFFPGCRCCIQGSYWSFMIFDWEALTRDAGKTESLFSWCELTFPWWLNVLFLLVLRSSQSFLYLRLRKKDKRATHEKQKEDGKVTDGFWNGKFYRRIRERELCRETPAQLGARHNLIIKWKTHETPRSTNCSIGSKTKVLRQFQEKGWMKLQAENEIE